MEAKKTDSGRQAPALQDPEIVEARANDGREAMKQGARRMSNRQTSRATKVAVMIRMARPAGVPLETSGPGGGDSVNGPCRPDRHENSAPESGSPATLASHRESLCIQ